MSYMHIGNLHKDTRILEFKYVWAMEKIHGCLHPDTMVLMADKTYKPIKDISVGDLVFSYSESDKKFEKRVVLFSVRQPAVNGWLVVSLESGKKLIVTTDHLVLTNRGWVAAGELTTDDEIIDCCAITEVLNV